MRKVLSIVLVALMVSMMIPAMAFAEETATLNYAGLVAGETFTVSVPAEGATKVTVSVNAQLFNIEGVEAANGIASADAIIADGVATLAVNVNDEVPAVVESSKIKIDVDGTVSYQYAAIEDRLLGDIDGDGKITATDAGYVLEASVGIELTSAGCKEAQCDLDKNGTATATEAGYVLEVSVGIDVTDIQGIGVAYYGGNAAIDVVDPFVGSDEPEVEETTLEAVTDLYAYYQNGTIYYAFEASANADENTTYAITVGETVVNVTETTGSFAYAADYAEGLEVSVVASSTTENYVASAAATAAVIEADASGALATWLDQNGLTDVAITVHEIK